METAENLKKVAAAEVKKTKILALGEEVLKQKSAAVKHINGEVAKFAEMLVALMRKGKGIGLAGAQVGVLWRIFVTHVKGDEARIFINPSILETSTETVSYEEGCLSIPGVYADVSRPSSVKVQAWNEKGKPFTIEADGLLARVIQHEYDHLDGTLFIDRLPEMKRERLIALYEKRKKA